VQCGAVYFFCTKHLIVIKLINVSKYSSFHCVIFKFTGWILVIRNLKVLVGTLKSFKLLIITKIHPSLFAN